MAIQRCVLAFSTSVFMIVLSLFSAESDGEELTVQGNTDVQRAVIRLENIWKVQPATSVNTPPVENDWGKMRTQSNEWRWGQVDGKGTSWEKTKRSTVNSIWYEQRVEIPADWQGRCIKLNFARINGDAIVVVNGKRISELLRPGGIVDITEAAVVGKENVIHVFCTRDYTDISRGFEQDLLRYISRTGTSNTLTMDRWAVGIDGGVLLESVPLAADISDVFIQTSWRNKSITVQVETNTRQPLQDVRIAITVRDADGNSVLSFESPIDSLQAGVSTTTLSSPWQNPVTWELDGGVVYTAEVCLLHNRAVLDRPEDYTFGFREIWTEGRELMMNGHPIRLRMTLNLGMSAASLSFFRMIGYNATYFQNNPNLWWRDWTDAPIYDHSLLDEMDRQGFAVSMPAPNLFYLREKLIDDSAVLAAFEAETNWFVRQYRNHPSVLMWTVGMNTYNPRDAISPQGMGRSRVEGEYLPTMEKVITTACNAVKKFDPTRLEYSHADGNVGDIASANVYLNFAPLQEREEWPMQWAASGDMPFMAAEFGQPYTANFWKGKRLLLTEYMAMLLGPSAYLSETDDGLANTVDLGLANNHHGAMNKVDLTQFPAYWDFQRLLVRQTNRAYRTWGYNAGYAYWNLDTCYGNPPGFNPNNRGQHFTRYTLIKEPVTSAPAWVSPNFAIHQQANKPLLAYVAGTPIHTDKTHSFYSGEVVKKNVVLVWDGPGVCDVKLAWNAGPQKENTDGIKTPVWANGNISMKMIAGQIKFVPIEFVAPNVSEKTNAQIRIFSQPECKHIVNDIFEIEVFPLLSMAAIKNNINAIALYDPAGESAEWINGLGFKTKEWAPGETLDGVDLLILGRQSLQPGRAMPFTPEQIQHGLKVLVLEQDGPVWNGLGFRTQQVMPRDVFVADHSSDVIAGLTDRDLRYWRGSPDLILEGKNPPSETRHAPKWTNRHGVSTVELQCPRAIGFTPVLRSGFDLDYTSLMKWSYGSGAVWFCSLDLTGRVGASAQDNIDPAASLLASNLISALLLTTYDAGRAAASAGYSRYSEKSVCSDGAGVSLVKPFWVAVREMKGQADPKNEILVVAPGSSFLPNQVRDFASSGGTAVVIAQKTQWYHEAGLLVKKAKLARAEPVTHPLFHGIGPNLLRWRDPLELKVILGATDNRQIEIIGGGVFAVEPIGEGKIVYLQVAPQMLSDRYPEDENKQQAVQTGVWRLQQLTAQLLTNLGVSPSTTQAQRLSFLDLGPQYSCLKHWNVLGPFLAENEDGKFMLETKYPGEDTAAAGDFNPNNTFVRRDGVSLDWRPTVQADEKGFINLGKALNRDTLAVAYAITTVESEEEREAVLRIGADWRIQVWVNGKVVFQTLNGMNKVGAYKVRIPLKKGENLISVKVGSGSKGFGFYADLSAPEVKGAEKMNDVLQAVSYYAGSPLADEFDPYEYFYW